MADSKLVTFTRWSPNNSGKRNHKVDRISIHHTASVVTVKDIGRIFSVPSREASSQYGIDAHKGVGQYVKEGKRAWTTSSRANDNRAITIEVSNDKTGGNWHVSDAAVNTLLDLCVDICKRYNKTKLLWLGKKGVEYAPKSNEMVLTLHKWFAPTACCGAYLESLMPNIAETVTKRLKPKKTYDKTLSGKMFKVTANRLNLHVKASKESKTIAQLKKGDVVLHTGYQYPNWHEVKYNGKIGFMSKKYLKKV